MATKDSLYRRFETVFPEEQAQVLAAAIHDAYADLVKTSDFNELKEIVRRLADAQERTEARMGTLAEAQERTEARMGELAEAQERTEARMSELAEAQERTEARMGELAEAQGRTEVQIVALTEAQSRTETKLDNLIDVVADLSRNMNGLRREMGGLSRGFGYSLENEAYRMLPAYLQEHFGITVQERIIRTEINGEEINFFARGERNGNSICLVGEGKIQIDERRENRSEAYGVLDQLERKANAVQDKHVDCEIVRLLVTHYARPSFLEMARKRDIIVVQSFEW